MAFVRITKKKKTLTELVERLKAADTAAVTKGVRIRGSMGDHFWLILCSYFCVQSIAMLVSLMFDSQDSSQAGVLVVIASLGVSGFTPLAANSNPLIIAPTIIDALFQAAISV